MIKLTDIRGQRGLDEELFFLYDDTVETKTRFVSFMGKNSRFDLAILRTDRYYGKSLVLDIQSNRFAIIGQDDLDEPGYLEHAYELSKEDAGELREFLYETI
ncbi:DUF3055 domain-containing protein [Metabacillus fastidiosus]|uniref:DUF3055 domain-containing protein n=1 Tax=Metabacillus fastidiosus TaxID=1458 RepID=UPI003D2E8762